MSQSEHGQLKVDLNPISLEADVAYFGARLEMVGKPETSYQLAQLKVFQSLEKSMEETLKRLRGLGETKKG